MSVFDYPIRIAPLAKDEGGGFLAFAPDLPGCMSDGETQEEAVKNVRDAIAEWLDEARVAGQEPPPPSIERPLAKIA